jgi:radical SAM superfamily enzyme YgiQ (UPF0313 family)
MHLGVVSVASHVRTHSRHEVRIVDFTATPRSSWRGRLREDLVEYRPDLVGMYLSTPYFPMAREVAAFIKKLADVPIVAGGHHATLAPEEVLSVPHFDWVIEGEGEFPMVRMLDTLAEGGPLSGVPGLWWREEGRLRSVPKAPLLHPDQFPVLDWSLLGDEILRTNFFIWGILPVMASRGCSSNCSFCSISEIQKRYPGEKFLRYRDPGQVVGEIEADYHRYRHLGLKTVQFVDLNFLANVKWLRGFAAEYRKSGLNLKLPWSAFTRLDHVTQEAIDCLADSGCVNLRVGIEAANPVMRNTIYRKNITQEQLETGLKRIRDAGISITGYFMAGGPGEQPEWLVESLDLAHRLGVDFPFFFLYKPLAKSEVLKRAPSLGSFLREDAEENAADFLHGVTMSHRHVAAWQLASFVPLAHAYFTTRMLQGQIRRAGPAWFMKMARYVNRAVRMGFPMHIALTYFVLYGEDHLSNPFRTTLETESSTAWRAVMAVARRMLPPSGACRGEAQPEICDR